MSALSVVNHCGWMKPYGPYSWCGQVVRAYGESINGRHSAFVFRVHLPYSLQREHHHLMPIIFWARRCAPCGNISPINLRQLRLHLLPWSWFLRDACRLCIRMSQQISRAGGKLLGETRRLFSIAWPQIVPGFAPWVNSIMWWSL